MEAYQTLDIDTFIMTAGSIVLSDNGLVSFFETPNAAEVRIFFVHGSALLMPLQFLSDKTGIEPNEAQAAFTAHIL
jgi:hypothetical protein